MTSMWAVVCYFHLCIDKFTMLYSYAASTLVWLLTAYVPCALLGGSIVVFFYRISSVLIVP